MILPVASRFLHWFTVGLIVPVLNLFLLSAGFDLAGVSLAAALYSAIVVVLELPTGILADFLGRKRTYLASLACSALGYAGLALLREPLLLVLAFSLNAVARALASGSLEALFIDRYIAKEGEGRLHRLLAAFNAAEASGLALGALAGGALPLLWSRLAPGAGRYQGNLLLQLLVVLGHGLLVALAVRGDAGAGRPGARTSLLGFARDSLGFALRNRTLRLLLPASLFWGLCFSAIELLWQPRLKELLGSDERTWIFGALSSGYFLAAVLGSALVPLLVARLKAPLPRLVALFRLLNGLFIVLLALQGGALGFGVLYLAMFSFNGMAGAPEATLFNREAPSERRASLLSLGSLAMQLGGIGGSLGFGLLAAVSSIPAAWAAAGAVFGASSLLYLAIDRGEARGLA